MKLSLCMIVRDAEYTLEPCLASIQPWVDEIVVVDTGSVDGTRDVANKYGARVFEFPWCDDFSRARNESISYAEGEWVFWMDADDTIDAENGARLKALVADPVDQAIQGFVAQVHCPAATGSAEIATVVDHIKLFRNRPEIRFEGRIHEQILPSIRRIDGQIEWSDVFVVHSGHDTSPEGQARKLKRDLRLLQLDLADRPDHPFVLFNLGMTLADANEHHEAIKALDRSLQVSRPEESHVRKAYALLASSLQQTNQVETASQIVRQGLQCFPDDPELLFRFGMISQIAKRFDDAERAYLTVLEQNHSRHFSSMDPAIHGFRTRHNLASVYMSTRKFSAAEQQWRAILESRPDYQPALHGLIETLLAQGRFAEAESLAENCSSNQEDTTLRSILLSRVFRARGDERRALAVLQTAVDDHPESTEALDEICRWLVESGNFGAAVAHLAQLAKRAPSGAAYHNLATALIETGQIQAAIDACRRSLEFRPEAEHTQALLARAQQLDNA